MIVQYHDIVRVFIISLSLFIPNTCLHLPLESSAMSWSFFGSSICWPVKSWAWSLRRGICNGPAERSRNTLTVQRKGVGVYWLYSSLLLEVHRVGRVLLGQGLVSLNLLSQSMDKNNLEQAHTRYVHRFLCSSLYTSPTEHWKNLGGMSLKGHLTNSKVSRQTGQSQLLYL